MPDPSETKGTVSNHSVLLMSQALSGLWVVLHSILFPQKTFYLHLARRLSDISLSKELP